MTAAELERELEEHIDRLGVASALAMLERVCYEKAEHVLTNWGDRGLAREWRRAAKRLERVSVFDWPL